MGETTRQRPAAVTAAAAVLVCGACTESSPSPEPTHPASVTGSSSSGSHIARPDDPNPLTDPLDPSLRAADDAVLGAVVLSKRGRGTTTFALPPLPGENRYRVLVNCRPSAEYKVESTSFFAGGCTPRGGDFGTMTGDMLAEGWISVSLRRQVDFWLVVVEQKSP